MSGKTTRFAVLGLTILSVNVGGLIWIRNSLAGSDAPKIRVLAALPTTDVDTTDRLCLRFDRALVGSADIGKRLLKPICELSPRHPGFWIWSKPDRLDFVLASPLPPGRLYRIRPTGDFEMETGRVMIGKSEFEFRTRPLQLISAALDSADRTHANVTVEFNQPVVPAELAEHLVVKSGSGSVKLEPIVLTTDPAERITLRIPRPPSDSLTILIDENLVGRGGELALGKPIVRQIEIPTLFTLLRARVDTPALEKDVEVSLQFSHRLDKKQAVSEVAFTPPVEGVKVEKSYWGSRLTLTGPFECGQRYTATVPSTLLARNGKTLGAHGTVSFTVPHRRPTVRIPATRGILMPEGNLTVDLKAVNVDNLSVAATRVYPNNLVAHLRNEPSYVTSRDIAERAIPLDLPLNQVTDVALDLKEIIEEPLGVYRVVVRAAERQWDSDSVIVAVTDLAITAKRDRNGYLVWITSLRSGKPVADAKVSILSYKNQTLVRGVTEEDGTVYLPVSDNHPDGKPWLITARLGQDLSYLETNKRYSVFEEVDQSGPPRSPGYEAMLYTERGVYRPGDTIFGTVILRDVDGSVPPAFPLTLTITRPDGREIHRSVLQPASGDQGVFHFEYRSLEDCQLGEYTLEVALPGSDATLGEATALIEAFLPVRIELHAEATKSTYGPEDNPEVQVTARYLFDKPASNLPLVISYKCREIQFESTKHPGFSFSGPGQETRTELGRQKTTLDGAGIRVVRIAPPRDGKPGVWQCDGAATITEPGGRSVSDGFTTRIDTAGRHLGLRIPKGSIARAGDPVYVEWIQLTEMDDLAEPVAFDLELLHVEHDVVLEEIDGGLVWKTVERTDSVWMQHVDAASSVAAERAFEVSCSKAGRYRIAAIDSITERQTQVEFHAISDESELLALSTERPERAEIILDKSRYAPGSAAKVLVRSPLSGTLLFTVETDKVLERRVMQLDGHSIRFDLPVDPELRGGAFLSASIVRAIDPSDDEWLPHRATGMTRLQTDHSNQRLHVELQAPSQVEPGGGVTVDVSVDDPTDPDWPPVVHLWAVDEGILLTTRYPTPDPFDHLLAQRGSSVTTEDVFAELLPDHERPAGIVRIGGDSDPDEVPIRRSPVSLRRQEPAVVWQRVTPIEPEGCATFQFNVPEMTGELRLMAIVIDQDRYGSVQASLTLTSPVNVEPTWPRFVAPGDRFRVPVKVFNSTDETVQATVTTTIDGPVNVILPQENAALTVAPDSAATVWLTATAQDVGQVGVDTKVVAQDVNGKSLVSTDHTNFVVRPVTPLHTEVELHGFAAGESLTVASSGDFTGGTVRRKLTISGQPIAELRPALDELLDYPYGCVEQTSSRLYALLEARDLLDGEGRSHEDRVSDYIRAGIARLWSMQTRSGGLSYWPGESQPNTWGSAYAGLVLGHARRRGQNVNADLLDGLCRYLKNTLVDTGTDISDNTRSLVCRVLSECGKAPRGWMSRLSEKVDDLDMAGRAHLAAAWMGAGRRDRAVAALPEDTIRQAVRATTSGRITSQMYQVATMLAVLTDLDADHPWAAILAQRLDAARQNEHWRNTQENAAAFVALAKYQRSKSNESSFSGSVYSCGRVWGTFDHTRTTTIVVKDTDEPIEITTVGEGNIFVVLTSEGLLRRDQLESYDHGLRVRRTWLNSDNEPVDPTSIRVGDLVQVRVGISAPELPPGESLGNVAIVDALGGMEVENPRLQTSAYVTRSRYEPDRLEFLDDRVITFTSVERKERVYQYALRAVTAGSFEVPPIQASSMYDPTLASLQLGTRVEISE